MMALVQGEQDEEDDEELEPRVQSVPVEMVSDAEMLLQANRSWESLMICMMLR